MKLILQVSLWLLLAAASYGDEYTLHSFQRKQLTGVYFSEGANAGDLNGDDVSDVVYGPYWFAGPDYQIMHEIRKPVPQDKSRFSWVYDYNSDGWKD